MTNTNTEDNDNSKEHQVDSEIAALNNEVNDSNLTNESVEIEPGKKSLRQYWLFFSGQLFSLFGSSVVQFAIIWWLTLRASRNFPDKIGLILSLASIAGFAPFVLTSLFAGVFVDRWNRKYVIGIADATQALITVVLLVFFFLDMASIPVVLVILAIRAVSQGFHNPATQAIIPIMVPEDKLTKVNSYQYLFSGLINLVGPVVGAMSLEFVGVENISLILWLDVVSFALAVVPLILIHIPDITKEKRQRGDGNFVKEFKEGLSFIVTANGLLPLLLTFTVANILTTPVFMLLPLVVISPKLLNSTAAVLGIIMAASQGGSILSSYVLTKKKIFDKNVNGVVLGQVFIYIGVLILAIGAFFGYVWLVVVGAFLNGISIPLANIHSQTIWQSVVPPELQGRVMSVRQTIAWILNPVAQLLGGILADQIGAVNVFLGGALIGISIISLVWFNTKLSNVEQALGVDQRPQKIGDEKGTELIDRSIADPAS